MRDQALLPDCGDGITCKRLSVLTTTEPSTLDREAIPRKIWTYWATEKLPQDVAAAVALMQKLNPGWEVTLLSDRYTPNLEPLPTPLPNVPSLTVQQRADWYKVRERLGTASHPHLLAAALVQKLSFASRAGITIALGHALDLDLHTHPHQFGIRLKYAYTSEPHPHELRTHIRTAYTSDPHTHLIRIRIRSAYASDPLSIRSTSASDPHPVNIKSAYTSDPHPHQFRIGIRSAPASHSLPHQIRIPIRSVPASDPHPPHIRIPIRSVFPSDRQPHHIHSRIRSTSPSVPHRHQIRTRIRFTPASDPHPVHIKSASPSDPHPHQIRIRIRSAPASDPNPHQTRIPI
jgi:hypothetical protein